MGVSNRVISVRNLCFSYGQRVILDNVSLELMRGQFLALLGPNGSGKSTFIKLILGLLKPARGNILVFGQPATRIKDRFRIGYVSQTVNTFNRNFPATIKEIVAAGLYGKRGMFSFLSQRDWQRVYEVLDQVGLTAYADHNIGRVSGGLQQRAFIARALVADPEMLILDEPTVGVDADSSHKFYDLLADLHQRRGLSMILVTHDIGVTSTSVDLVACLNKKLFFHGKTGEFADLQAEVLAATYGHEVQIIEHKH